MPSESPVLRDDYGRKVHVGRMQAGAVCVSITDKLTSVMAVLSGERLAAFTGAVNREAMPGQPATAATPLADAPGTGKTTTAPDPEELADEQRAARGAVDAARDARRMWNDAFGHDPF